MSEYTMGPYELAAYRSGATIREIARRGQDTLTRIWLAGKHQERLKYAEKALSSVSHCFDMSPPQTLGELCLLENERRFKGWLYFWTPIMYEDWERMRLWGSTAHNLRRAMWHKTGDHKEQK